MTNKPRTPAPPDAEKSGVVGLVERMRGEALRVPHDQDPKTRGTSSVLLLEGAAELERVKEENVSLHRANTFQSVEIVALKELNGELVKRGRDFYEAMALGPLDAAAKYGPDFDLEQHQAETADIFRATLPKAKAK